MVDESVESNHSDDETIKEEKKENEIKHSKFDWLHGGNEATKENHMSSM